MSTDSVLLCAATSARPASSVAARSTTGYENSSWASIPLARLGDVELLRVGDRQWTQHDRVDERKDRAARADAKRQRQHRDGSEAWSSDEQARAETQIAHRVLEPRQSALGAHGFHRLRNPARAEPDRPNIIIRDMSATPGVLGGEFEMLPQFLFQLSIQAAGRERPP